MRRSHLLGLVLLFSFSIISNADVVQNVSLNTPALAGISGYLDFQFNPSAAGAPSAQVVIESFSTDGSVGGNFLQTGGATGTLSSTATPLTIQNLANPPANEDAENFVIGKQLSFVADFSGTAISNPDPANPLESTFSVSLYNANGSSLFAQNYTVTPNGTIMSTATPEPGELWLICAGLALLAGIRLKGLPLYTRGK